MPAERYWEGRGIAAPDKSKAGRVYGLHDTLTFGKHKGRTVLAVLRTDAQYAWWAHTTTDQFTLNCEAELLLDYHLSMQRDAKDATCNSVTA